MSNLIDRVGGSIDAQPGGYHFSSWTGELSPGEMQIISFLRLLYHHQPPRGMSTQIIYNYSVTRLILLLDGSTIIGYNTFSNNLCL